MIEKKTRKKYTMSEKRKLRDFQNTNWEKRKKVIEFRKLGMSSIEVGKQLSISDQRVLKIESSMKKLGLA